MTTTTTVPSELGRIWRKHLGVSATVLDKLPSDPPIINYEGPSTPPPLNADTVTLEVVALDEEADPLLASLIAPHLSRATRDFARRTACLDGKGIEEARAVCLRDLRRHMAKRLVVFGAPSMAVAFHAWCMSSGRPVDWEAASKFRDILANPAQRTGVLRITPLLDSMLTKLALQGAQLAAEIITRAHDDSDELSQRVGFSLPRLTCLEFGLGDHHNDGRTVVKLVSPTGTVIYKPRSVAAEVLYYAFAEWLSNGLGVRLPTLTILDRDCYGWVNFVSAADCNSRQEVRDCYYRLGAQMALLHVISGSDIHFENLVVDGPWPYLVDLETIFGAREQTPVSGYRAVTQHLTRSTVLNIGYLPRPSGPAADVTAGGLTRARRIPNSRPTVNSQNGNYRIVAIDHEIDPATSLPRLHGRPKTLASGQESFEVGFRDGYLRILAHRDDLATADWLRSLVASISPRWVPRPTQTYGDVLRAARHPSSLRSLDSLARILAKANDQVSSSRPPEFFAEEFRQLWNLDIPVFHASMNCRSLFVGDRRVCEAFFDRSGFEEFNARLGALSPEALERQINVIRLSILSTLPVGRVVAPKAGDRKVQSPAPKFLDLAREVGDAIVDLGFDQDGRAVSFVGLKASSPRSRSAGFVGLDLYAGLSGIAVFLAALGRETREHKYSNAAELCISTVSAADTTDLPLGVGAFGGLAGVVYAMKLASRSLDLNLGPSYVERLEHLHESVEDDDQFDVVGGAAGALLVSLALSELKDEFANLHLATADRCAERLRVAARRNGPAASWRGRTQSRALTGFSHGTTGIAAALSRYAQTRNDRAARELAIAGLHFERPTFNRERGLWADLRTRGRYSMAWCHGAPGMTTGRRIMAEAGLAAHYPDLQNEIEDGVHGTLKSLDIVNRCLCHGLAGNLDPIASDPRYQGIFVESAHHWATAVQADLRGAKGFVPGFMTGLAGIGYAALRFENPKLPNVLAIEIA